MVLDRTSLGDVKDGRAARPHFNRMLLLFVHTINIINAVYYIHYIAGIIHFVIAMLIYYYRRTFEDAKLCTHNQWPV